MSLLELEVLGTGGGRTPLPESGAVVLGSSPKRAGLVLSAPGVDGMHAAVGRLKDGGWALRDLGSAAGTTVNGQRVASVRISHGDVIALGEVRVRVVDPTRAEEIVRDATADAPLRLPERIGGFRIQKRLGRGGMGDVYLAVQESLSRPVALKVLSPRLDADAEFVRRFEIEARAAAILNHPNVVVVHDVGKAAGHHYLAMEYMDRGSLEEHLTRGGPLPWREAVEVLHDAASGLVYAEERGIVHRDIKPANLMRNSAGMTKIADLGLALTREDESEADAGRVFGTPHFISPEQARGETPDHRSDLYSLGATMYRLLSGRTPFEGETTRDILRAHFQEEPEPLHALVPGIPSELSDLVARLLAKEPAERPESAAEVVQAARLLRSDAELGTAAGGRRARPVWLAPLLVVAAVVAVLSGLYVGGVLGGGRAPAPPSNGGPGPVADDGTGGPPALPEGPTGGQGPATDDLLRLAEREAELDLREIELRGLRPEALRAALRELSVQHAGTAVAAQALLDAQRIDEELAAEAAAVAAHEALLAGARASLVDLPELAFDPPRPAAALSALAAAAGPEELEPGELEELKLELADEVVDSAVAHVSSVLDAADTASLTGEFERVEALLTGLAPVFAPVPSELTLRPAGLVELQELGRDAALRLEGLAAQQSAFAAAAASEERGLFAAAIAGPEGVEGALRRFELGKARARMLALGESLLTPALAERASAIGAELSSAEAALAALIAADRDPGWRRHSILDPREGDGTFADAAGVDAQGIALEGGDRISWAEFAASPAALLHLFRGRLERNWTESESRGIAALLRIAGTLRAVDEVAEVLLGEDGSRFRASEADAVEEAFAPLVEWTAEHGIAGVAEADVRAAHVLGRACLAASEGHAAEAVARLEYLLTAYSDSLLVLLLSDGSDAEPEQREQEDAGDASPGVPEDGSGR